MNDNTLDNPFWQFACALYQKPGVAERLHILQDDHGFNVNLLLFLLWVDKQHLCVDRNQIEHCSQLISSLDNQIIKPLRHIRRLLKTFPDIHSHHYEQAKSMELALEQELCAILYQQSRFIAKNLSVNETNSPLSARSIYLLARSDTQKTLISDLLESVD